MEDMKSVMKTLREKTAQLEKLADTYTRNKGWVVESENHVNVGMGHGLNGTEFAVKTAFSCCMAQVYDSREAAEKYGCDYYLVDGAGRPIEMRITAAGDFFAREAGRARSLLLYAQGSEKGGER